MSSYSRHRLGTPSPKSRPIRQKLQFVCSDGEDDSIEDVNNSTGGESGFTEMDSPTPLRRDAADKLQEGGSSPLNHSGADDDVELWDEESLDSPSRQSPSSVIFANCSPSPKKASRLYGGSPERSYIQDDGEGSSSPIPDCPDTPPHKTFRKLRLFDTPHTPKVLLDIIDLCEKIINICLMHELSVYIQKSPLLGRNKKPNMDYSISNQNVLFTICT